MPLEIHPSPARNNHLSAEVEMVSLKVTVNSILVLFAKVKQPKSAAAFSNFRKTKT